jgi:hypothetical protein
MATKSADNKWWVETSLKRPKQAKPAEPPVPLGPAMSFYAVAKGYDQERAKEDLTDNNLKIAREANPPVGNWTYVAMTEEHYPEHLIRRIKEKFRIPREARGIVIDHGRVVRLLVCGPELEDWMIDVTLSDEPSVDVYVWGTMWRERIFRRAEDALHQARRWALSLIHHPPKRDDPFRGALL